MMTINLTRSVIRLGLATAPHFMEDTHQRAIDSAEAIDRVWYTLLLPAENGGPTSGGLYHLLTMIGLFLAVGTLILFLVQWARNLINNEIERPLTDLLWPLLVAILLAHQGHLLALTTIGIRNSINYVNTGILEILDQTLKVEARLADMYNYRILDESLDEIKHSCDGIGIDAAQLQQCKQVAAKDLEEWEIAFNRTLDRSSEHQYRQTGQQQIAAMKASLRQPVPTATQRPGPNPRDKALDKVGISLLSLGQAFQRTLESCMLITAVLGPLAVGASLTPIGSKPIFSWLSALLSLGLAKFSYNVLTAIAVSTFYFSGEQNFLFQDFVHGALNPIVAFGVAAGGGKAIFDSLISASPMIREQNFGSFNLTNSVQSSQSKR